MSDHREMAGPDDDSPVQPWERIASDVVGEYGIFAVVRHRSRSPRDGSVHTFHVLDIAESVVIIPLTEDGRIVMVEQFRHAVQRPALEFPAGFLEPGEDPVAGALRELEEETGYRAGSAERVGDYDSDPAKEATPAHVVIARGCVDTGSRDQDDGEDVHVTLLSIDEVEEGIRTGRIRASATLAAWLLACTRSALRPDRRAS